MSKIKRPTLTTTKNCIMLLKEAHANAWNLTGTCINHDKIGMVLTMLTDDKRWMEK